MNASQKSCHNVTSREDVWYDFYGSVGSKIVKKLKNVFDQNVPGYRVLHRVLASVPPGSYKGAAGGL